MQCEQRNQCRAIPQDDEAVRLRTVMDTVPALVAYIDRDGIYRLNNRTYELWFGRHRGEITGHHVRELLGEDTWLKIEPRLQRAFNGEQVHYEDWLHYRDSGPRWMSVVYTPDFDCDGEVLGVTVIAHDVTEERRTQIALRRHAEMLKVSQDAIFIWRVPGGVEFWNNGAAELYGYTTDEVLGRNLSELLHTRFPRPWNEIEMALLSHRRWEGVLRHRTKDGRELIVHSRVQRIPGGEGTMLLLESARDITEQSLAEAARRETEERFRAFMEHTTALTWMKNAKGEYVYLNPAYERHVGARPGGWLGKTDFDFWPRDAAEQFRANDRTVIQSGKILDTTEETVEPGNVVRTWFVSKFPLQRENGEQMVGGIALDMTERKRAEAALRREHVFNTTLLSTTVAVIVVLDREGNIVHINRAFEAATGYSFEEIRGQRFFDLFIVPEEVHSVTGAFHALRTSQGPSKHVNFILTREGGRRLIEWSNSVLFDDRSEVDFIIATGLDITERREMEREILEVGDRERQRIGQDLHDGLGQELTALDFFNHTFLQRLRRASPSLVPDFEQMTLQLRETIRHARMLSHGLLPVPPEPEGLVLALRSLARSTESTASIMCRFECDDSIAINDSDIATHLYRITQEAVNNAVKHAHSKQIEITLRLIDGALELSIADDGEGFAPAVTWDEGMGLRIMNYRAELIGARLRTSSTRGHGVRVTCTLPITNEIATTQS